MRLFCRVIPILAQLDNNKARAGGTHFRAESDLELLSPIDFVSARPFCR